MIHGRVLLLQGDRTAWVCVLSKKEMKRGQENRHSFGLRTLCCDCIHWPFFGGGGLNKV